MKKIFGKWCAGSLDYDLKTLRGKVDQLTALESDNLAAVKNAEIQPGKKRKREVELWFTNVKDKQSELKQIEVEIREQVGYSTNLKSRIEKETKEVEELIQQGKFPKGVVLDDHASTRLPMVASRLVGQSCTENTESILRLLKEEDVLGIGIYGMGGVGKTTLVKEIHNFLLSDTDIGGRVYWVTASRDCSLEKLQNEIGKAVGLEDISQKDNERRKALLSQRLVKMGKSVLIIDDLWKHYLPELIGIPLEPCGCKIVITTRSLDVCRKMGCQKIVKLEPLLEKDAMQLFVEKLGAIPSYLNKFAEEIVSECGGLPLALITMGCCMRGKDDVHDWENALYELRRPVRRHDDMEEEVFRVLEFSFDNLKDEKVQNCFLTCVLFREDESIKRDELVDLWINEGLLDEVENRQDRVKRGHAILNRLIYLCLLESPCDGYVKMHDLLRDMAIIITQKHPLFFAKSGLQLERVPEEKLWSNDLVKVSLSYNDIKEIPCGMAPLTPHLTVLILNNNPLKEIPESFFEHMRALKVLDLSWTNIERLPESVSKLENLRVLLVNCCSELTSVPLLEKLTKLKVLNFGDCEKLTCVPSVEKLTELRVLEVGSNIFIEAPKGIERLKCLEKVGEVRWDKSDITGFNKLIQSSPSLNCYTFWLQLSIDLNPLYADEALEDVFNSLCDKRVLVTGLGLEDEETSYLLPTTIEMLLLNDCDMEGRRLGDVFPTLARATDLQELHIQDCPGLIDLELGRWYSKLRKLTIIGCPGLKVVIPFAQHLCLPNLESLKVEDCDELEEIFESNKGTLTLPNLELGGWSFYLRVLMIIRCPGLKVVIPQHLCLPNLESLVVNFCRELEEIFESNKGTLTLPNIELGGWSFSYLRELKIEVCRGLKVVIPFAQHLCLPNLKSLKVEYCHGLEEIFESNKGTLTLPNLELGGWSFSYLRELMIIRCQGLKVVIPQHLFLPNLESLTVKQCDELEEIFESNKGTQPSPILSLPKLKRVTLLDLPKLNSIYRGALICISIREVQINACPKLKLRRPSSPSSAFLSLFIDYPQDADDIRHHINGVSDEDSNKRVTQVSDDESDETDMSKWLVSDSTNPKQQRLVIADDEHNEKCEWAASLSLSSLNVLIPNN